MKAILTEEGKKILFEKLISTQDTIKFKNNPFLIENEKGYYKFDSILIEQNNIFFSWEGINIFVIKSKDDLSFKKLEDLKITGIEGRMQITFERGWE